MACNILVQLPSSFFSMRLVSVQVVLAYSRMDTNTAGKNCFILSDRSDFHMTDSLSIAVHAFASRVLMTLSVDEMLLPRKVNLSISFLSNIYHFLFYVFSKILCYEQDVIHGQFLVEFNRHKFKVFIW